jgi:anti-repressor protein
MMNNLAVIESDGILVVDSRLVADQLGIQHRSFFQKVILKYQPEIEEDWGVIRFQIAKPSLGSSGGRPERYALLSEQQAT